MYTYVVVTTVGFATVIMMLYTAFVLMVAFAIRGRVFSHLTGMIESEEKRLWSLFWVWKLTFFAYAESGYKSFEI